MNPKCSAIFDWRRAVRAKENTEFRFSTFVRKGATPHIADCPHNHDEDEMQHREVSIDKDDYHSFRIQFPFGSAPMDLYPNRQGLLLYQQKAAANNNLNKRPMKSLKDLVDFVEHRMHGLEDPMIHDVCLYYQGEANEWDDVWTSASEYSKLLDKSRELDVSDRQSPVLALVKPDHEGETISRGKVKFICTPQLTSHDSKIVEVRPVLVCPNSTIAGYFTRMAKEQEILLIASRPFQPQECKGDIINIYLSVANTTHLARVSNEYWKPVLRQENQLRFPIG